jgi:hypothetical protein
MECDCRMYAGNEVNAPDKEVGNLRAMTQAGSVAMKWCGGLLR